MEDKKLAEWVLDTLWCPISLELAPDDPFYATLAKAFEVVLEDAVHAGRGPEIQGFVREAVQLFRAPDQAAIRDLHARCFAFSLRCNE